jgi:hypothetical protein
MITQEQFEEFLTLPHEIPAVEFKGPGNRRDNPLFGKVVRAAMGMANRRDGGFVIIGVADHDGILSLVGLTDEQLATWRHDDIADGFAAHADPAISFDSAVYVSNGMRFVVLQIYEYTEIPIVCKQEYMDNSNSNITRAPRSQILRKGACYIRRRYKAETLEISTAEDMRSLLEMAIEKGLRKFITQAQRAGLSLSHINQLSDQDFFDQQLESRASSSIETIKSRGYWRFVIRPNEFNPSRIRFQDLQPLIERTMVSTPGIDFPMLNPEILQRDNNSIGQESRPATFLESWHFYQSGLFVDFSGIIDDWSDRSNRFFGSEQWTPNKVLSVEEIVLRFTGIFDFASRLALTDLYSREEYIHLEVLVDHLQERRIYLSDPTRVGLRLNYQISTQQFFYPHDFLRDELIARPRELALDLAQELIHRFNWQPRKETLEDIQSRLGGPWRPYMGG